MQADSRQTDFCTYLSAILLSGLLLNAIAGWWWADPAAGLVMVPIIGKEGLTDSGVWCVAMIAGAAETLHRHSGTLIFWALRVLPPPLPRTAGA